MHRLGDPVDPWVAANLYDRSAEDARRSEQTTYSFVAGVDEDDFVVLVHTVLVDPVRVEHTEVAAAPADTLLCDTLDRKSTRLNSSHSGESRMPSSA